MRIAINGYGRIGHCIVRAIFDQGLEDEYEIIAINDLADNALLCHLTRYDSTLGVFKHDVQLVEDNMLIEGKSIQLSSCQDATQLPWEKLDIDICFECSGHFASRELASHHLQAGAKKVLVSQPCADADKTIVYGVNHQLLRAEDTVVSNASCTTNCLAPLLKVLTETVGVQSGMMTTIHSYTNDQNLIDKVGGDFYRSRSATQSMIPTKTGAAKAVGLVLPELDGKLNGMAIRVPTINVSLVDLYIIPEKNITIDELHQHIQLAANTELSAGGLKGILAYNDKPLVSVDFKCHTASSIFDANHTSILGSQLKLMSWYDNEWAFSLRMLDVAKVMMNAQ
ncbi:MAG: glyceraldehyde 3-phosphate dehydrogenase [Candidatus Endobugula sp.]|jgi:glyceraldehyde 3-phosphate dehydrogenase